jgi:hypothetical protein
MRLGAEGKAYVVKIVAIRNEYLVCDNLSNKPNEYSKLSNFMRNYLWRYV